MHSLLPASLLIYYFTYLLLYLPTSLLPASYLLHCLSNPFLTYFYMHILLFSLLIYFIIFIIPTTTHFFIHFLHLYNSYFFTVCFFTYLMLPFSSLLLLLSSYVLHYLYNSYFSVISLLPNYPAISYFLSFFFFLYFTPPISSSLLPLLPQRISKLHCSSYIKTEIHNIMPAARSRNPQNTSLPSTPPYQQAQ